MRLNKRLVIQAARLAAVVLLFVGLGAGCTLAPTYVQPDAPIPNIYASGTTEAAAPLPVWKDFFRDKTMQRVIDLALQNNRDLRVAMLNIEVTRAQYRIQRADILPTINAAAGASSQHLPAAFSSLGVKGVSRQYTASLGFSSFELDLFGRIRSLTEQALETYYSVEEEARTAYLSLVAETAAMYLQLVADREIYDLTAFTLKNRQHNYDLVLKRFEIGVASDLELSQAEILVDEARTYLAAQATQVGLDENYLALLMGTVIPADLPEVRSLNDIEALADLPEGLPSSLLERRPDILAAEHVLKGANANIGAARANFFPTITLTTTLGKMSTDFSGLFDGAAKTWTFFPHISLPIFDMGRNIAQLQMSEAERDIAVARYEKAIQSAFREVADALTQRENIGEQLAAQESLVSSSGRSYNVADIRYRSGVSAYINVLEAQQMLYSAQSNLISTRLLREANALTLYKALGGGWPVVED